MNPRSWTRTSPVASFSRLGTGLSRLLTVRQIAALFGTSKSAADRIIDDLAPKLALRPRQRYAPGTVLIVDGTLVPTRDRSMAAKSKNYRYSTNHQVVIHAESGIDHATRTATVIADGGYPGTRAVIPHRRIAKDESLIGWKEAHNASHRHIRAQIEHTFAKMKRWNVLRDCRLRGDGVAEAMSGIARLHNLTLTG
ncbi:DDE superfamily endonuclease [Glycomyces harbinensis]|uniref:DDE superfamily endonuclease n=1 Tax=Glycomyces harbinensis TaxID=58114 RepID=A0A1G6ZTJ5_9ACTN|nr:DDE superfamily endonuclease [Glycomyces harbinensis]